MTLKAGPSAGDKPIERRKPLHRQPVRRRAVTACATAYDLCLQFFAPGEEIAFFGARIVQYRQRIRAQKMIGFLCPCREGLLGPTKAWKAGMIFQGNGLRQYSDMLVFL